MAKVLRVFGASRRSVPKMVAKMLRPLCIDAVLKKKQWLENVCHPCVPAYNGETAAEPWPRQGLLKKLQKVLNRNSRQK